MELGLYSFAELGTDPETGTPITPQERLKRLLEEIVLAEQVGLDVFGVGEHHRPDFAVSAPAVVLGAAAARTSSIRLTTAVNILSTDDPIRVFQQMATVDLLSEGRAEIMVGRGSFIESFPLFGYPLETYDELFEEKLARLLEVRFSADAPWADKRGLGPSAANVGVYPRPVQDPIPLWVATGGSSASAKRIGSLGLPMALAIIGGLPERFRFVVELYKETARSVGGVEPVVAIDSHGFLAPTSQEARRIAFPAFKTTMSRIGKERGWPPITDATMEFAASPRGADFIGSPQEVIDKILYQHEIFGHRRFLMQMTVGPLPHKAVLRSIELFGTEVAPVVRKEIGIT